MKRFWTIFFQVIWILIWPAIAGLIYYFVTKHQIDSFQNWALNNVDNKTEIVKQNPMYPFMIHGGEFPFIEQHISDIENANKKYFYITLIDIIGFIDLVWYIMNMKTQDHMDILTTVGNYMILDIPAYYFAKKSFEQNKLNEKKEKANKATYKKLKSEASEEQEIMDDDVLLSSWEKEQLKKKNPEKYKKAVKKERTVNVVDFEVETTRKIIRGFGVYVLSTIYKKEPKLVNTYDLISKYKKSITDNKKKLTADFIKAPKKQMLIAGYDAKVMTAKRITDAINETEVQEFSVALTQDRVQMQIDAKDYLTKTKQKQIK